MSLNMIHDIRKIAERFALSLTSLKNYLLTLGLQDVNGTEELQELCSQHHFNQGSDPIGNLPKTRVNFYIHKYLLPENKVELINNLLKYDHYMDLSKIVRMLINKALNEIKTVGIDDYFLTMPIEQFLGLRKKLRKRAGEIDLQRIKVE